MSWGWLQLAHGLALPRVPPSSLPTPGNPKALGGLTVLCPLTWELCDSAFLPSTFSGSNSSLEGAHPLPSHPGPAEAAQDVLEF